MLSQSHYIIVGEFGLKEDTLEHTSAEVFGTVFRRICAIWMKRFIQGNSLLLR